MVIVAIGVVAWLAVVACCAGLCTIASRGDRVGGPDLAKWRHVADPSQDDPVVIRRGLPALPRRAVHMR